MTTGSREGSDLVFTPEALRAIDRAAVERYAIPSIVLMENASRALADEVLALTTGSHPPRVLVACGKGNNGGDGLACARHLHNAGVDVEIVLVEPAPQARMTADAATNLRIVQAMGLPLRDRWQTTTRPNVVVDALLGTGTRGAVAGPLALAIDGINALADSGAVVVAADLPSGMDAMTGRGLATGRTPAVAARKTVTFVGPKPGFFTPPGRALTGDVVVAGIGCPIELLREFGTIRDT